jgi:hypothetical protein
MKLEFSQQSFEKYSNIKFRKSPSSGSRVITCGWKENRQTDRQTDRHDEANSRFSQFCERAQKWLICSNIFPFKLSCLWIQRMLRSGKDKTLDSVLLFCYSYEILFYKHCYSLEWIQNRVKWRTVVMQGMDVYWDVCMCSAELV